MKMAYSNPNNLNAGMRCIKYMLFIINAMFVLTAVLLITVGTTIQSIFGKLSYFIDDHFLSPPTLMVAVGAIIFIVAVFGCMGALKESTMLINIFGVLLILVFILEVSAAISAFALQPQISEMLNRTMYDSLDNYVNHSYIEDAVDFMQEALECCGVHQPEDWRGILPSNQNISLVVPESCCVATSMSGDFNVTCNEFFLEGCFNRMSFIIAQSTMLIATGAITVAFVQILGVICAFMLAKTIRKTKSLRAARKYQLQQSMIGPISEKNHFTQPYTQLADSEKSSDPVLYVPTSPSVN